MSDKHQLVTGEECSLFNSGHEYRKGYNYYHCTCKNWSVTAKRDEASNLFLAHVIQAAAACVAENQEK
jgi:hypothetical protein